MDIHACQPYPMTLHGHGHGDGGHLPLLVPAYQAVAIAIHDNPRLTQALLPASSNLRVHTFRSPSFLSLIASKRSMRKPNRGSARFLIEVSSSSGTASHGYGRETELEATQASVLATISEVKAAKVKNPLPQ